MQRRLRSILAAVSAVAATSLAIIGVQAVAAQPASAICKGTGSPVHVYLYYGGNLVADETVQYNSTCDNDNYYAGKVRDDRTDGHCAYARYYDAGTWSTQGVACTTGSYANYSFRDRNGDHSALFDLDVNYAGVETYTYGY
jgi:hypothetical protein